MAGMTAGAAGTMPGIIAIGIMAAWVTVSHMAGSASTAGSTSMAAATAKKPVEKVANDI
jgi:hypothetical protein